MEENKQVVEETTQEQVKQEINNKKSFTPLICIAVILLGILYFAYTKVFTPKNIFVKSVNKEYAKFEEKLDKYFSDNKDSKPIMLSNEASIKLDIDSSLVDSKTKSIIDEINKLSIKNEIGYDQKNKTMLLTLDALYSKEDLFNIGAYVKDEKMYLELKNLFDKYIEVPFDSKSFETNSSTLSNDEMKYLLSKSKDAVLNNLKDKDFKKSSEKITVNKKSKKVTKITYRLSEKSVAELGKASLEDLSKDSKYIKILSKLTDMKESEVKKELEESIKNIDTKDLKEEKVLEFSIFVQGVLRKNAGYELKVNGDETYLFACYKNKKEKEIKITEGKNTIVSGIIKDDKANIKITVEGQEMSLTVKKTIDKKVTTYDYDITVSGAAINGKVVKEVIKENEDGTGEYKIKLEASMMGLVSFEVNDKIKIEYKDKVTIPNVKNSVKYEELTEADMNSITTKLYSNKALMSLIEKLTSYSSMSY